MKKILFPILLIALLFTACGGNAPAAEEPVVDEAATAVAEVLYATQTAMAAEKAAAEVVEVVEATEEVTVTLNTDYTDAAPVYTQLIVGLLKLKDTAQAVTAGQASTLVNLLSSLANTTPENSLTEDSINEMINQAVAVLSADQIQAISAMQITDESARTVLQDMGLEMGGNNADGQPGEGGPGGGPVGEGGEPPAGDPGQGGPGGGGAPGENAGEAPSGDQEMDRGIMIQPQLIQALIEYLQSISA